MSLYSSLRAYALRIFRPSALADDMREELSAHIALRADDLESGGMPRAEAERRARIEFGARVRYTEACQEASGGTSIATVFHDLRFAVRMIRSHVWFSAAVVVTLALGIGLNTMVFTIINAALFKPVPVPGGARLVAIVNWSPARSDARISYPDLLDYRAQTHSFAAIEGAADQEGVLGEPGNPPQAYHMERVTTGVFSMLHMQPMLGRNFLASDANSGAAPVVILGYDVWQNRYAGSRSAIGRQVRVNEKPATIIGVMPKGFMFPTTVELWMPLVPTANDLKRDDDDLQVFGLLRRGVRISTAQAELGAVARRLATHYPEADRDVTAFAQTFNERYNGGSIEAVFYLMLASVGFVLLIACANVANMMLSRAIARQREMSIRAALGASRWRVIRQLLIESVVLSILGGGVGLGLATFGVRWFDLATSNVQRPYWIQFTMDYSVFGYFAGLCIVSGVLFGIAPALRSSRPDLNRALQEGARSIARSRGGNLAAILVVFQLALTIVLLTGAGVFVHSLLNTLESNKAVPQRQLMVARLQLPDQRYGGIPARQRFYDQLLPRLRALPGVTNAALVSNPPGLGSAENPIEIDGERATDAAHRPMGAYVTASPGYFKTIRLPLLLGRDFNSADGSPNHRAAIVTRGFANRFWPSQQAIGRRFRVFDDQGKPGDWITVVGVTANLEQDLTEQDPKPLFFVPTQQEDWGGISLVVESTTNPIAEVRDAVASLDEDLPLREVYLLNQAVEHQTWYLRLFSKIFIGFALIALLMAAVGIYAVLAQATNQRTQEIGIRIALGASLRNIMLLVIRRGLWQIGLGLALGLAAAFPAARLMANLPIGVSPTDPAVFIGVATVLVLVGLIACWLPARRAAAMDPVAAIRRE
ncbi:MAG: ADOP family duplicated permease [Acidobacteriota bacterium]